MLVQLLPPHEGPKDSVEVVMVALDVAVEVAAVVDVAVVVGDVVEGPPPQLVSAT